MSANVRQYLALLIELNYFFDFALTLSYNCISINTCIVLYSMYVGLKNLLLLIENFSQNCKESLSSVYPHT